MSKFDRLEEKAIRRLEKFIAQMRADMCTTSFIVAAVEGVKDQALWRAEIVPMPNPFEGPTNEDQNERR